MCSPFRSALVFSVAVLLLSGCSSAKPSFGSEPQGRRQAAEPEKPQRVLHVVADPNNLPFSNDKLEGFENKIADVIAKRMNAKLQYSWRAQRRGFFRHAFEDDGGDLVLGVPAGFERALTTAPYYRSSYVFVWRKDRNLDVRSLNDPVLRDLKISAPLPAFLIHSILLWLWHIPAWFNATIDNEWIHTLQHLSFLVPALLFWWALIHHGPNAAGYGLAVLYLFLIALHSQLLGVLMTFARTIWYTAYAQSTQSWGLSPLQDQQLAGLIMWIPAGLVYIVAALALMAGWMREAEARAVRREEREQRERETPATPAEASS